jgi:hypothetical protein
MSDSLPSVPEAERSAAAPAPAPVAASPGSAATRPAADPKPARRNFLFYAVICLLILDIVCGLGLALFAQAILLFPPMAVMGLGLAILGVGIMAYFLLVGDGRSPPTDKKP